MNSYRTICQEMPRAPKRTSICIHKYIHTYVHTYIRTYVHTYIHIYLSIYLSIDPSIYLSILSIYLSIYLSIPIHTHIHTHIYTYMLAISLPSHHLPIPRGRHHGTLARCGVSRARRRGTVKIWTHLSHETMVINHQYD